tara:strand:- start:3250 stop:4989 length:1740 start_codon:yes stop_codon:yes gene_type:complete
MDISKQPINTSTNISQKPDMVSSQSTIITDINALKLEVGKVYSARVIQANDKNLSSTETALKTPAEQPASEPKPKTLTKNEWLILVKGKVVLISSEKPLEIGQKLLLKLESSAPGEKPTLLAQVLSNKSNSYEQKTISPQLSQTLNINNTSPSVGTQSQTADTKNIQLLLQALNLTLDKQLPLKQGFDQLSNILQTPANVPGDKTNSDKTNLQILQTVKKLLLDTLPKRQDFAQTLPEAAKIPNINTPASSALSSSDIVKNSLLNSGVLLEKTLLSEPNKLLAFKEQLASIENLLPKSPSRIAASTSSQNAHSAISKIQQTIESLLQLAANQTSKTPPQANSNSTAVQFNDLKANLITASALLSKQLSAELSATELKNIFLGANIDEAFISPFAFPIISSASMNSSKALFDKQEFSTGQILKILAGMIHKLQFNQLNSLLQTNSNIDSPLQQTWFFELPILNPNQTVQTFNFRIDKEPQQTNEEQESTAEKEFKWKLLLSFDLDSLGPIYIQITLSKESISSVLWADKDSTLQLLQQESMHFKHQLEKIGLKVEELHCKKGQPNQTQTKLNRHLVDTKV